MENYNSFFVQSNKTVVVFLIKFFGSYALLFLIYNVYLNETQSKIDVFACAPITNTVAHQTKELLNFVGYNAFVEQHANEVSVKLLVNNKFVARIIEGCNSISVIILFTSFIIAFSNGFKRTLFFIICGSLLIYISNVFRIATIAVAIYKYPEYENILHSIVFPLLIYGMTFMLWFLWIRKFSKLQK